jgi:glutamyl/glutaminyl-tRNA synthetase
VRGADLADSTAVQLFLAQALVSTGLPGAPGFVAAEFLHHPIIAGDDGTKLSKSTAAGGAPMQRTSAHRDRIIEAAAALAEVLGVTPR